MFELICIGFAHALFASLYSFALGSVHLVLGQPSKVNVCPSRNITVKDTGIIITSPGYPDYHRSSADCNVKLRLPLHKILKITLTNFATLGKILVIFRSESSILESVWSKNFSLSVYVKIKANNGRHLLTSKINEGRKQFL